MGIFIFVQIIRSLSLDSNILISLLIEMFENTGDLPVNNVLIQKNVRRIPGRVIKDYEGMESERLKMKEKMATDYGRIIYHTRKKVVECIFGHIKSNLGLRDFLLRGRKGAKIEFNLACIASNLRRIWNYLHEDNGKSTSC